RQMRHTIDVVVDRLEAGAAGRTRLAEAVEAALRLANGSLVVSFAAPPPLVVPPSGGVGESEEAPSKRRIRRKPPEGGTTSVPREGETTSKSPAGGAGGDRLFSSRYACTHCGISYEPPSPQLFSFNSPQGMCPDCNGLALRHDFDLSLLIP